MTDRDSQIQEIIEKPRNSIPRVNEFFWIKKWSSKSLFRQIRKKWNYQS